jgi:hypothetical protein
MANFPNKLEPATDLLQKAQNHLKSNSGAKPGLPFGITPKKAKSFAVVAALLGVSAFTATQFIDDKPVPVPQKAKEPEEPKAEDLQANTVKPDVSKPDSNTGGGGPTIPPAQTVAPSADPKPSLAHGQSHPVAGGTITPNEHVAIAQNVDDTMSFEDAFAAARTEVNGGEGIFTWHGEVYNTYLLEEWTALSIPDRQVFLANAGYKPVGQPLSPEQPEQDEPKDPSNPEQPVEPAYIETVVDGKRYIGVDTDGDGIVDELMVHDEKENRVWALYDESGNEALDTIHQLDPNTLESIQADPIPVEDQFELTLDQVEAYNHPDQTQENGTIDEPDDENESDEENPEEDEDEVSQDDNGYHNRDNSSDMT